MTLGLLMEDIYLIFPALTVRLPSTSPGRDIVIVKSSPNITSSAAIDIVPGPGSSWDKLYAQMSSPEVRTDLAKYGLDILDETSAATMKKTGATGKHFHVGKGYASSSLASSASMLLFHSSYNDSRWVRPMAFMCLL